MAEEQGGRRRRKVYDEQTEEDLNVGPMSSMQKGVLILAVLGIVAFLAYVVFF